MADVNDAIRAQNEERLKRAQRIAEVKGNEDRCPVCEYPVNVRRVEKAGKNNGRLFFSCGRCNIFEFLDQPQCPICKRRTFEAVVKKGGPNHGRTFSACPNHCPGTFRWKDSE